MNELPAFRKFALWLVASVLFYYLIIHTSILGTLAKGFSPVFLAFALAYLLDNMVRMFMRLLGLPRPMAILTTVLLIVVLIVLLLSLAIPRIVGNIQELINSLTNVNYLEIESRILAGLDNEYLIEVKRYVDDLVQNLLDSASDLIGGLFNSALIHLVNITSSVMFFVISFVIGIYILFDKKELIARLKRFTYAFFRDDVADRMVRVTHTANDIFQRFVIGKLIDSSIIGVLCYGLLIFFTVPFALIIAIVVGITNMIPYFGPFIGAIPALLITLINSTEQTLLVLFIIIALQQFDGLILGPLILGDRIGVSAFWIIVSVTVGGYLFGVLGMFLGVPFVVLVMTIVDEEVQRRLNGKNLGHMEQDHLKERKPLLERLIDVFKKV